MGITCGLTIVLLAILFWVGKDCAPGFSFELFSARPDPSKTMAAASYSTWGSPDVIKFYKSVPQPKPLSHQVLIEVKAAAINPCDFKFRRAPLPWPLSVKPKPYGKIPGQDVAGVVVKSNSDLFKPGDRVTAMMDILGSQWGSAAQFAAIPASYLAHIPDEISFQAAASIPLVALTTIQAFNKVEGGLNGKRVLIHAGAGGVGSFAIQYAKSKGAIEVATTCSGKKTEFVRSLGADVVIDYTVSQFDRIIRDYDVVLDTMSFLYEEHTLNANNNSVLSPNGHYLNILSSDWQLTASGEEFANGRLSIQNWISSKVKKNLMGKGPDYDLIAVVPDGKQLQEVLDMMNMGTVKAIIDRTYPLQEVNVAHLYLETGHATGKVIIDVAGSFSTIQG